MKNKVLILALLLLVIFSSMVRATNKDITIYIDGQKQSFMENEPLLKDDRIFLPVRQVAEKLGLSVSWNKENKSVQISSESKKITMKIGEKNFNNNNQIESMDVSPFIENERTYVPLRFLAQALGKKVSWNNKSFSAYIDNPSFLGDPSLDKYLDKDKVYKAFTEEIIGSAIPRIEYANENYSALLNYNGILIIDNKTGLLKGAIDNRALGYNLMQGDDYVSILGNDNYFIFLRKNKNQKSGYVYSIEDNKIAFYEDASSFLFKEASLPSQELEKEILNSTSKKKDFSYSMVSFNKGIATFEIDYTNLKNSKVTILNQNLKEITEFKLGSVNRLEN